MPERSAISVIVPCWRDERALARLLDGLGELFARAEIISEIIVVDGADNEQCRQLCERYAARWLPAKPCRGEQLRLGASHARHPLLWFLHADAQLHGDPLPAMQKAIASGATGGYFRFRFAGRTGWQGKLLEQLITCDAGSACLMEIRACSSKLMLTSAADSTVPGRCSKKSNW